MKLENVLEKLNSYEKSAFIKVTSNIITGLKDKKAVEDILSGYSKDLKAADSIQVAEVFNLISDIFYKGIIDEYSKTSSQLDILLNILTRDGNCILRREWFGTLYEEEFKRQRNAIDEFKKNVNAEKPTIDPERIRDYKIYDACLYTAYHNDEPSNFDPKITADEQSLLDTLAEKLELSQDERTMIKYAVLGIPKLDIDDAINYLRELGLIFFSKKTNTLYVADEVVTLMRKAKGKDVADKYFRRMLLQLREPQINTICRKHGFDYKLSIEEKIRLIINSGVSFSSVLKEEIYKPDVKLVERRKFVSELCDEQLKITPSVKGSSLDEKVANLVAYFDQLYRNERLGISVNGFERLVMDLAEARINANKTIKETFQLQEDNVLDASLLAEYNIMPRDILELLGEDNLKAFCESHGIKAKGGIGSIIDNIMEAYKDSESLFVENYLNIANRDLNSLKENGIIIKEAEIGVKFEDITKYIFGKIGFNVDEDLRRQLNTEKDKIDILLRIDEKVLALVECKTCKENGYNRFSAISRQVSSYKTLIEKNGYQLSKIMIVAPEFSEDFISDCENDFDLNLSLITAPTLKAIYDACLESGKNVNINMFMRDVLVPEAKILRALKR